MARTFGRCLGCGDPLDSPDFRTCSRCAVLLEGMEDLLVEPPAREPGCDDVKPKPKPKRDGKWLAWAAAKRGQTRWFHAYGAEHGFPRDMRQWSVGMTERAVQAKLAKAANS